MVLFLTKKDDDFVIKAENVLNITEKRRIRRFWFLFINVIESTNIKVSSQLKAVNHGFLEVMTRN